MKASDIWFNIFKSSVGRFFSLRFKKDNGQERFLNGKIGSKLIMDKTGHLAVLDVRLNQYRKVNLSTLESFKCGNIKIKV